MGVVFSPKIPKRVAIFPKSSCQLCWWDLDSVDDVHTWCHHCLSLKYVSTSPDICDFLTPLVDFDPAPPPSQKWRHIFGKASPFLNGSGQCAYDTIMWQYDDITYEQPITKKVVGKRATLLKKFGLSTTPTKISFRTKGDCHKKIRTKYNSLIFSTFRKKSNYPIRTKGTYPNILLYAPMVRRVAQSWKSLKSTVYRPNCHYLGPKDSKITNLCILSAGLALPTRPQSLCSEDAFLYVLWVANESWKRFFG